MTAQAPREGLYPNWNRCVERAKGEYVYIATSDDTMAPDCLEKLVRALDSHPDCDLAHCPLIIIDEAGATRADPVWPDCTIFARGMPDLVKRPHIRRAPYDGLIHITGEHVVLSMTQLLIRRSLFAKIGPFGSRWGSVSDFNWEMKAGLVANMIHVPDTWASWRLHALQATASIDVYKPERDQKFNEMIQDAVDICEPLLPPAVVEGLRSHWLPLSLEMRDYYAGLRHRRETAQRRAYQFSQLATGTSAVRSQIVGRLRGSPKWPEIAPSEIKRWLEQIGIRPVIADVSA